MPLPWVRLDTTFPQHDKILGLIGDRSSHRWRAIALYTFGLAWSGGQGTDGTIPAVALPMIHGTAPTAELLEQHRLWIPDGSGWRIHNWDTRQRSSKVSAELARKQRQAAARTNCMRYHDPGCECWKDWA